MSASASPNASSSAATSAMTAIILAAGQGTRMKSTRAKVLHELCGRPMLHYVIQSSIDAGATDVVVVVGFGRDEVTAYLERAFGARVRTVVQEIQRGTGDAARCALPLLPPNAELCLVLCGDTPLLTAAELVRLTASLPAECAMAMLTCDAPDPTGYGRILRATGNRDRVIAIREHRDCTPDELAIREVNPAMYFCRTAFLRGAVADLRPNNAQGELYFTDVVATAAKGGGVFGVLASDASALVGINDRAQLAAAEDELYRRIADEHRKRGATIRSSARIDASVVIEPDAIVEHAVVLRGTTHIGSGARIDVGCVLTDVDVGAAAEVKPYSVCMRSTIGERAQVGPFSHLRPDSRLEAEAHIGNFVETKKTIVRRGAKANHLAYLGDGDIGEGANIGAGTIFCNYDGVKKHTTVIGSGAFIGSDSQLVAPIRVGVGAYVATGTTVTRDVPDDALAIARVRQENKEGYATRLKAKLKGQQKTATRKPDGPT